VRLHIEARCWLMIFNWNVDGAHYKVEDRYCNVVVGWIFAVIILTADFFTDSDGR